MSEAIQTNYPERLDKGRAGQIVNTELCNTISRTVINASGVGFGLAVQRSGGDRSISAMDGEANPVLGVTVRDRSVSANAADGYLQYDSVRVMTKGPIFVDAPVAVNAGDPVYVVLADGSFHNAAAAGRQLLPNAVWDTSTTAAGLAVVALDIR